MASALPIAGPVRGGWCYGWRGRLTRRR